MCPCWTLSEFCRGSLLLTIQEHMHGISNQKELSNEIGMQHRKGLRRHLTHELPQPPPWALNIVDRKLWSQARALWLLCVILLSTCWIWQRCAWFKILSLFGTHVKQVWNCCTTCFAYHVMMHDSLLSYAASLFKIASSFKNKVNLPSIPNLKNLHRIFALLSSHLL